MAMRKWRCPHCKQLTVAAAVEVGHRCTNNRNRWTWFKEEETDE